MLETACQARAGAEGEDGPGQHGIVQASLHDMLESDEKRMAATDAKTKTESSESLIDSRLQLLH
jgi:hypothetical protein